MDPAAWYAVALGGLVASFAAMYALPWRIDRALARRQSRMLAWPWYRLARRGWTAAAVTPWRDVLVAVPFLVANVVGLTVQIRTLRDFVERSGLVSVVNTVPLLLGGRMSLLVDWCGVRLGPYAKLHRWLGRAAAIEGLIHMAAGLSLRRLDFRRAADIAAVVAVAAMAVALLSKPLRQYAYEIFAWLHAACAVAVVASVYVHLPDKVLWRLPSAYLLAGTCLFALGLALWATHLVYRNVRSRRWASDASVRRVAFKSTSGPDIQVQDAVHVHVRLARPWTIRAGQYLYLGLPGTSRMSFAQLHPFYIAWGYTDGRGDHYAVCVVHKRKGFTRGLLAHANGETMRAVVEGPFGRERELGCFETVLLFATGIGIASQLLYVSQLLEGRRDQVTERIVLFWQVESEVQTAWVADRMQTLLQQDVQKMLDVHLFVRGGFLLETTSLGDREALGSRMDITYQSMEASNLMRSAIVGREGRVGVLSCTDAKTYGQIHRAVREFGTTVALYELDFVPQ